MTDPAPLTPMDRTDVVRAACMGRGCDRPAAYEVRGLIPDLAVTDYPVQLCRYCMGTEHVDFFKWVEATRDVASIDDLLSPDQRTALYADLEEMARARRQAASSAADFPMA